MTSIETILKAVKKIRQQLLNLLTRFTPIKLYVKPRKSFLTSSL